MEKLDIRPCTAQDVPKWQEFLNKSFGYGDGESFAVDFAPLFEPEALANTRLAWDQGKIVSCASLYKVVAVAPHTRLELGIIGAVATDEEYRGRGHSRRILEELEALARSEGLFALILWSDKADHYAKLGFVPVGHQVILPLEKITKPTKVAEGTIAAGWNWAEVEALYDQHPSRVIRSPSYWKAIQKITSCSKVQWVGKDGKVLAYVGFGRGKDMKGIVHEWGGEIIALHSLLWAAEQARPGLHLLAHPKLAIPIRRLLPANLDVIEGQLALAKPLKAEITAKNFESVWFWGLDSL